MKRNRQRRMGSSTLDEGEVYQLEPIIRGRESHMSVQEEVTVG